MNTLLFSSDSIWTMLHGLMLGGGAMLALAAALFALYVMPAGNAPDAGVQVRSRYLTGLLVAIAVLLWLTIIGGTYVIFPPYRATPPEGLTDLSQYPRSLLQSNPGTAWLHGFGMEIKEHVPWIAAMLATAVAFIGMRYRGTLLSDSRLRRMSLTLLAVCFVLVAGVAVLGVFINKVAPLE
jgi:hypothetical protein